MLKPTRKRQNNGHPQQFQAFFPLEKVLANGLPNWTSEQLHMPWLQEGPAFLVHERGPQDQTPQDLCNFQQRHLSDVPKKSAEISCYPRSTGVFLDVFFLPKKTEALNCHAGGFSAVPCSSLPPLRARQHINQCRKAWPNHDQNMIYLG